MRDSHRLFLVCFHFKIQSNVVTALKYVYSKFLCRITRFFEFLIFDFDETPSYSAIDGMHEVHTILEILLLSNYTHICSSACVHLPL